MTVLYFHVFGYCVFLKQIPVALLAHYETDQPKVTNKAIPFLNQLNHHKEITFRVENSLSGLMGRRDGGETLLIISNSSLGESLN